MKSLHVLTCLEEEQANTDNVTTYAGKGFRKPKCHYFKCNHGMILSNFELWIQIMNWPYIEENFVNFFILQIYEKIPI